VTHQSPISRRHFLRGVGVTIALPWLETLARADAPTAAQRFVCVANPFGMIRDAFFPKEDGLKATLPVNLAPFEPLRGKFTVFSNHPFKRCTFQSAGAALFERRLQM
jgi:hypothetical protein